MTVIRVYPVNNRHLAPGASLNGIRPDQKPGHRKIKAWLRPLVLLLAMGSLLGLGACNTSQAVADAQQSQSASRPDASDVMLLASADASVAHMASVAPSSSAAAAQPVEPLVIPPDAREAVVAAREAVQKKNWKALGSMVERAQPDPMLGSWAQFWHLRQQLQDPTQPNPDAQVEAFIRLNDNPHLSDRLAGEWVVAAVRAGDYTAALRRASVQIRTPAIECSLILARHMTGLTVTASEATSAFSANRACWTMLDELAARDVVRWEDLSFELRAILETSKTEQARRMAAIMFTAPQMQQYTRLMEAPRKWLSEQKAPQSQADIELVTIALSRLARSQDRGPEAAFIDQHWAERIPARNLEWVYSQFGLIAALRVDPDAARWYRLSGNQRLTDYNHAWQVRSELRQAPIDWPRVQSAIERMGEQQASEPVWVYWLARALQAQGETDRASRLYASITHDLNFYGQLANEELGRLPYIPERPSPVAEHELAEARNNINLQRAIQLFRLGWRVEGIQQWHFTLRGMSDRELLAAAEYAREEQVFDRVVNTSLQTKELIDFDQRFVAPFAEVVNPKSRQINLDPAWVYGLIRQESRFMTDVRSHAGASGLMQLMPATASWVAKKIGMTDFHPSAVNDFEINTILGTNYLRMVLDRLDGSEVLASAGYNAGPKRPIRWRSRLSAPVEGAVFAETIPFTETRLYVKNVLSNAVYYSMMFTGEPQSLKQRLGTIAPKAASQAGLP